MLNAIPNIANSSSLGFDSLSSRLKPESRKQAKEFIENNASSVEFARQVHKAEEEKVSYLDLESEVRTMLSENNLSIEFAIDDSTKEMIMKVVDAETKETVKQFPSEVSLKIARILTNTLDVGSITNVKV